MGTKAGDAIIARVMSALADSNREAARSPAPVHSSSRFFPCPYCKGRGQIAPGGGINDLEPPELCGACADSGDGRKYKQLRDLREQRR